MWNHYANYHTEYASVSDLKKSLCADSSSGKINDIYRLTLGSELAELREVKYKDECPGEVNILNLDRIEVGKQVWECFLTKYRELQYEKEYRMLLFKKYFSHGICKKV